MVKALVEWFKQTTLVREEPGSIPVRVKNLFLLYLMDVIINAPVTCLTLNSLQKSDGRT